jgi:predicted Zn-dependent protease
MSCPACRYARRDFLTVLAGAGAAPLAACSDPGQLGGPLVSPRQEQQMGAQEFAKLRHELPRSANAGYQRELQAVGRRIVAASGSPIPPDRWDFVVFASEQVNAFALPGGHVGAFEGMMQLVAGDDAELAAVLGHEVGHVIAHHSAQRVGTQEITQLGIGAVAAALQLGGYADARTAGQLLGAGAQYGIILPFSRGQELEADRLGLTLMAKAGYDPRAAILFWRKMMAGGGARPPAFLSTHPSDRDRIARLEALLPEA